tara:strand:- start:1031 stop:1312 length:282 start_codon:yes stop_codon:yes gene_type:complete
MRTAVGLDAVSRNANAAFQTSGILALVRQTKKDSSRASLLLVGTRLVVFPAKMLTTTHIRKSRSGTGIDRDSRISLTWDAHEKKYYTEDRNPA